MIYTIAEISERITPIAKKHSISAVCLFGSYARGMSTEGSDIDLIIDTGGTRLTSLFTKVRIGR